MANKKKHDAYFSNPSSDLKSARKNTIKTLYSQTRCFFSKMNIGKLHCGVCKFIIRIGWIYKRSLTVQNGSFHKVWSHLVCHNIPQQRVTSRRTPGVSNISDCTAQVQHHNVVNHKVTVLCSCA